MNIRPATRDDLAVICELTNAEIENGVAHFATAPVTLAEMQATFDAESLRYPWLVATASSSDVAVAGYAKAGPWKTRGAYAWSAEVGIYIAPDHQRRGYGRALYTRLFEILKEQGYQTFIAGITLPNPGSVALHEAMGMTQVAHFRNVGFKHNQWLDVGYWSLSHATDPPGSIKPVP